MCGICGILDWNSLQPSDILLVKKMMETLRHRGPNDEGLHINRWLALGHRRLSIIDLTGGHQPISNEDGTVWAVFNGEIYNYQDLTARLAGLGHRFRTRSDSETLVHLYEEKGEALVDNLRGMFSFALWDSTRERLIMARDRLGIKPLLYAQDGERLVFASELKALRHCPDLVGELDLAALDGYLTLSYVPGSRTIFSGVKRLLPGHLLVCDRDGCRLVAYWQPQNVAVQDRGWAEAVAKLGELLEESVRLRLVGEVPLGVFLSGGLDSSAIVAMMARLGVHSIQTFSVGFGAEHRNLDETSYARAVAQRFHANYHEIIVAPSSMNLLPRLVWHLDEPLGDPAVLPLYQLTHFARNYVTVVLCGDGGDEVLGGYDRYLWEKVTNYYQMAPGWARALLARALADGQRAGGGPSGFLARLGRFVQRAGLPPIERYPRWLTYFDVTQRSRLYAPQLQMVSSSEHWLEQFLRTDGDRDWIAQVMCADLRTYLPFLLLEKGDRVTMSGSLEARFPFLDHRLVEYALSLPTKYKLRGLTTKPLLRCLLHDILPEDMLSRKKRGFTVPVHHWFRHDLIHLSDHLLSTPRFLDRGLFQSSGVEHLLSAHRTGQVNYGYHLWLLVVLEIWCRLFLDGDSITTVEGEIDTILRSRSDA